MVYLYGIWQHINVTSAVVLYGWHYCCSIYRKKI